MQKYQAMPASSAPLILEAHDKHQHSFLRQAFPKATTLTTLNAYVPDASSARAVRTNAGRHGKQVK
jgi:hypothetical protein